MSLCLVYFDGSAARPEYVTCDRVPVLNELITVQVGDSWHLFRVTGVMLFGDGHMQRGTGDPADPVLPIAAGLRVLAAYGAVR